MSVETAGASFSASIPSISVETSIASVATPSTGSEFSQSFSNIPGPEIPSSIITEISRPAGMEFESIPEPLVGDFDIHDIIAEPFAQKPQDRTFQTQIEPATFLNPKIGENLNANADPAQESTIFEPSPDAQDEEILKEAGRQLTEPALASTAVAEIPALAIRPTPANQEVGIIAGEILTLGAVEPEEIQQTESQSDAYSLKEAMAILETSDFTQDEKALWKTKLEKAVQPQAIAKIQEEIETQVETDTQSTVETEAEAESATAGGSQPPDLPTAQDGQFEMERPEDEIEEEDEEEPKWDVYHITDKWQNAEKVNKKRVALAGEIAFRATQKDRPILEADAEIYKLDVADVEETIQTLQGKLKKPAIAHEVYAALSTVDEKDPQAIGKAIVETVRLKASEEAKPTVTSTEKAKESELPPAVQELAANGAREVLWKNNKWRKGRVLFQNPIEVKKAA